MGSISKSLGFKIVAYFLNQHAATTAQDLRRIFFTPEILFEDNPALLVLRTMLRTGVCLAVPVPRPSVRSNDCSTVNGMDLWCKVIVIHIVLIKF